MKTILFDQNAFDTYNGRYIDSTNLLHFFQLHKMNTYLLKKCDEEVKDNVDEYIKGIISYTKLNLRTNPIEVFNKILVATKIKNLSDLLIISSDQEFLYLFDKIAVNTCLIYKNKFDCMEINPTYEFRKVDNVKKIILK